jgi:hypothetical protein
MFEITIEDVERSSTMTKRDVGKFAFVLCGSIQILPERNRESAERRYREIMRSFMSN